MLQWLSRNLDCSSLDPSICLCKSCRLRRWEMGSAGYHGDEGRNYMSVHEQLSNDAIMNGVMSIWRWKVGSFEYSGRKYAITFHMNCNSFTSRWEVGSFEYHSKDGCKCAHTTNHFWLFTEWIVIAHRWEVGSFGYHGDDGRKYASTGMGEEYGPHFGAGDIIGAGLHLETQELFFT